MGAVKIILFLLIGLPLLLVFGSVFFALWIVFTVTLIGPILQCCCNCRDAKRLDRDRLQREVPDLSFVEVKSRGDESTPLKRYRLAVRFSKNPTTTLPPVCIPNGLGATMTTVSQVHEMLIRRGYTVLSYDRLGVGLSDPNSSGISPTADEVVDDMETIMSSMMPRGTKWILLGPSMGSIVAQCYIAKYPQNVCGLLNMDGLPYPFCRKRATFAKAKVIYKIYGNLIWTGVMRPFISLGVNSWKKRLQNDAFSLDVIKAEVNKASFFRNLALEMDTMMDLAETATEQWGRQSCLELDPVDFKVLVNCFPRGFADVDKLGTWGPVDTTAGPWSEKEAIERVVAHMQSKEPTSPLARIWQDLVVRVMSARSYDYAGGDSFYDLEMRDWAAAEHAQHALFAADGARTVYPRKGHGEMFGMVAPICDQIDEISKAIEARNQGSA